MFVHYYILQKKPKTLPSGQNDTILAAQDLEGGMSRKRRETEKLQDKENKEKRQASEPVKQGGRANVILVCHCYSPPLSLLAHFFSLASHLLLLVLNSSGSPKRV